MTPTEIFLRVLYALIVVGAAWVIGSWLTGVARRLMQKTQLDPLIADLLGRLVHPLLVVIGVATALSLVGLGSAGNSLLALVGGGAVAIGLALKDYVKDIAAGALILTIRPFGSGDSVELAGTSGLVGEIGLFATRIDQFDGNTVLVPNSRIVAGPMLNLTTRGTRRITVPVRVSGTADLAAVQTQLLALAAGTEGVLETPAPSVMVGEVRATGTDLTLYAWAENVNFGRARSALNAGAHSLADKAAAVSIAELVER